MYVFQTQHTLPRHTGESRYARIAMSALAVLAFASFAVEVVTAAQAAPPESPTAALEQRARQLLRHADDRPTAVAMCEAELVVNGGLAPRAITTLKDRGVRRVAENLCIVMRSVSRERDGTRSDPEAVHAVALEYLPLLEQHGQRAGAPAIAAGFRRAYGQVGKGVEGQT